MKFAESRSRLLASAALGATLAVFAAQPARAQITTTDATRETLKDTSAGNSDIQINGAIDGFGLAFTNIGSGGNTIFFTNNGSIQVDAGNTPTAGGSAALNISATGTTKIDYSGAGDIVNLGTGDGFGVQIAGTGSLNAGIGGDIRADAGDAIQVASNDPNGGFVHVGTTIGAPQTIASSGGDGINILTNGTGQASIVTGTGVAIVSGGAGVNTLQNGMFVESTGAGDITIINNGAIGSQGDRAQLSGITAKISNAGSAGGIIVSGDGDIFSVGSAIFVRNDGSNTTTVDYTGTVDSLGRGVRAESSGGGAIDVTLGKVTAAGGAGIEVEQTSTTGTGAISVTANDAISGTTGIIATNAGLGGITVTTTGTVTGANGNAIFVDQSNATATGDVTVTIGTGGATSTDADAVEVHVAGSGNLTVDSAGDITANGIGVNGISATHSGTAGNLSITTAANTTISAVGAGINATIDSAGTGALNVVNGADIASSGPPGTINLGINATTIALGTLSITNTGAIGSDTDRIETIGINAAIQNGTSSATLSVTGSGAIFAGANGTGIVADNSGSGATIVSYAGTVDSGGIGVTVIGRGGGAIDATLGAVTAGGPSAVNAQQLSTTGSGAISVTTNGAISGQQGIVANNVGLGGIAVQTTGLVTGSAGNAILVNQGNGGATGDVTVTVGAGGATATGQDAVRVHNSGTGNLTVNSNGGITANGAGFDGIFATHGGTAGNLSITTAANKTIRADGIGIEAFIGNSVNAGALTITNGANIISAGAANSIDRGIEAFTSGLGAVTVSNTGVIGSSNDRMADEGIIAEIGNTSSTAALSVTGSGDIFSAGEAITAINRGKGVTTINYTGAIDSTVNGGNAVFALSSGGAVSVTLGKVTATGGTAVKARQSSTTGTGAVSVTTNGAISGAEGIEATNAGLGGIGVTTTGPVTGTAGNAILAAQTNAAATGDVLVVVGVGGATSTGANAVSVGNAGTGALAVSSIGDITANGVDFNAIDAVHTGTVGTVLVATAANTNIQAGGTGINAQITNPVSTGTVTVVNGAAIGSVTGDSIDSGIAAGTEGLGLVSVSNNGAIGSSNDRAQLAGIDAFINNGSSSATLGVFGTGNIFSSNFGIGTSHNGSGSTTINYSGSVDADNLGVGAFSNGGAINVTVGAVRSSNGLAIDAEQVNASGTGAVVVTANGPITGVGGIDAINLGSGGITVTTTGPVTAFGNAIFTLRSPSQNSPAGNVLIDVGAGGATSTNNVAVVAQNFGNGTVTVNSRGAITSNADDGILARATTGATAINIVGGSVTGGGVDDGIDADATTGTISVNLSGGADVTGVASGIRVDSAGAKGVTIGAGSVVSGASGIIALGGSTVIVSNSGTLGNAGAVAVRTDLVTAATVLNQAGGVMNGRVDLSNGSDTVSNSGTWNASGGQNFLGGTDIITNLATGTINVAAGTVFNGLEVFANSGTLNAASGLTFDAADTSFINSATFAAQGTLNFGAGTDLIANQAAGTVNVAAGTSILGLESFTNAGTLNVASGVTFDGVNTALTSNGTMNAGGAIDFGAGSDVLTNQVNGTVNIAAGTSILGLETLDNFGQFSALAGLAFDGGNTSMTNTGRTDFIGVIDFGAGTDSFTNSAGAILAIGASSSFRGLETLNNNGLMNVNDGLTFDAGNTALNNAGQVTVQGVVDFGGGTDSFANTATGLINLSRNTMLAGLESFTSSGRILLGAFTLTGPAIAFTNSGTIDTNGNAGLLGFTSIANAGTIDLAAGIFSASGAFTNSGTILVDEGASTIAGQTGFTNSGRIVLADGATGDRLTINSGFVGSGGSNVLLDVSSTTADVLVIGGAASGSTVINLNLLGNLAINTDGILLVDTGTSAADNTFTLGTGVTGTGLVDIGLRRVGQDFFLIAAPNANAFDPLALINIGTDMWFQSADVYSHYAAVKRSGLGSGGKPLGLWGQVYWNRDTYGDRNGEQSLFGSDQTINQRLRTRRRGIQLGADYSFGMGVIGATLGWQRAEVEVREGITDADGEGYNIGAYALVGSSTGLHGSLLVKKDINKLEIDNSLFKGLGKLTSKSFGVEAEIGYRLPVGVSTLDLGGGVAWVNSRHEDFALAGIDYHYDKSISLRGNLGARFESPIGVFIDTRLFREFRDDNDLTLASGTQSDTLEADGRGTWFRGELGYGKSTRPGPIASIWGNVGDVHGVGAKLGFRF